MIGLDTNALLRFVIWDEQKQAQAIAAQVARARTKGARFYINDLVLAEMVWVLKTTYAKTKTEIAEGMQALLETSQFEWENKQLINEALRDYSHTSADFVDCLIGRKNLAAGCEKTLSFDKATKSLSHFELLKA